MSEPPVIWGGCGACHGGVTSDGYLVWDKTGKVGTFACPLHLAVVKARNPGGKVEML